MTCTTSEDEGRGEKSWPTSVFTHPCPVSGKCLKQDVPPACRYDYSCAHAQSDTPKNPHPVKKFMCVTPPPPPRAGAIRKAHPRAQTQESGIQGISGRQLHPIRYEIFLVPHLFTLVPQLQFRITCGWHGKAASNTIDLPSLGATSVGTLLHWGNAD